MIASALGVGKVLADVPQENVRLRVDSPGPYVTGDTVRFSATLIGGIGSRYLYVELIDPFGSVRNRVKIKEHDGRFTGYMPLDRELPESTYTLAAYTMYMQNRGADHFFRMPLEVRSIYSYKYKIEPTFAGNALTVKLTKSDSGTPVECESLILFGPRGVIFNAGRKKSSYRFKLPDDVATVMVKFDNFLKFIAVPVDSTAVRPEFYPEGGALVPNTSNALAIRTSDVDGRPMRLSGAIVSSPGDTLCRFQTDSAGLDKVHFFPCEGERYFALTAGKSFEMPSVRPDATALQVIKREEHFTVNVIGAQRSPVTLEANVSGITELLEVDPEFPLTIPVASLTPGVVDFTLLSADGEVISQRSIFNGAANDAEMLARAPESRTTDAFAIEIGGEISGTIKSRWRGKPLKGASVNILAPSIDLAVSATTDEQGRFRIGGFDWPDGTAFAIRAVNANGNPEHNFAIDADTFPAVRPLPQPVSFNNYVAPDGDLLLRAGIMLKEITVTARHSPEETFMEMYKAMGARLIDSRTIAERAITTYEEAIRTIPSLRIVGGRVISTRSRRPVSNPAAALPEVPFCIGGVAWNPEANPAPESNQASTIATNLPTQGGEQPAANGMPAPESLNVNFAGSREPQLKEFAAIYPFHTVESIMYIPPMLAAAYGGMSASETGILMVTLKNGSTDNRADNFFLQIHRPLGYQR